MLINENTGQAVMDESGYTILLTMINGCIRANEKINNLEYRRIMSSGRLKISQVIFFKAFLRVSTII